MVVTANILSHVAMFRIFFFSMPPAVVDYFCTYMELVIVFGMHLLYYAPQEYQAFSFFSRVEAS